MTSPAWACRVCKREFIPSSSAIRNHHYKCSACKHDDYIKRRLAPKLPPQTPLSKQQLTQDLIKEYFSYNPETGDLRRTKPSGHTLCGDTPYKNNKGYMSINFCNKKQRVHRLVFLYMTGKIPQFIDHIDGNRTNNAWHNLRPATLSQNRHNCSVSRNKKSGLKGVRQRKTGKWEARIGRIHLGSFNTAEEAAASYAAKARELFGEFARAS